MERRYEDIDADFQLRSERVRDLIGKLPGGFVRDGVTYIAGALLLLAALALWIPFPESVHARGTVVTLVPDEDIVKVEIMVSDLVVRRAKPLESLASVSFDAPDGRNVTFPAFVNTVEGTTADEGTRKVSLLLLDIDRDTARKLRVGMAADVSLHFRDHRLGERIISLGSGNR